jgi:glycogen debranching enzyme
MNPQRFAERVPQVLQCPQSETWPSSEVRKHCRHKLLYLLSIGVFLIACVPAIAIERTPERDLELSRAVRPWEFLSVLGSRAGVLGAESGHFEAWAYPLKILRDFHLNFLVGGTSLPADSLVRSIVVRPEATTLLYASDTFSVRETIFVPREQAGMVITLEVETSEPMEIEAAFERDFKLEWPAPLGGASIDWEPKLNAFVMGEPQGKFAAVVGSPSAHEYREEYATNSSASPESSMKLGITTKGTSTKLIAIAASSDNSMEAEKLYNDLLRHHQELVQKDVEFYREYLNHTVKLTLPDSTLEQAYKWAQISMLQGLVQNPTLGTGLVAGYSTSGRDTRPGYAWFFGRDALWTTFALNATGDFATARQALEFLAKYQREDGKVPHEIAQGASYVPWLTKMPYAYSSADATPLYIIAVNDYVHRSGDVALAQKTWDNVWRAYQFLISTYDERGLPQNTGVGHGWIEGGPLYPIHTELYQSGLGLEAIRALSSLAALLGKEQLSRDLLQTFDQKQRSLNQLFWVPGLQHYALGLDDKGQQATAASVLSTVPMWFGLLDAEKANATITELSGPDHQTDWGMRILSSHDSRFEPNGYHWGTVWPLFTGWASVAEFRYHRPLPAFQNLRTNALLTFDGALGHVTEVLSGSYYQTLQTGSPHQIWSAAMVVSPLLQGMLGLHSNAITKQLVFEPHVPADWTSFGVQNVKLDSASVDLKYTKTSNSIALTVKRTGGENGTLDFLPAISLRTQVRSVLLNGKRLPFSIETNTNDQHVVMHLPITDQTSQVIIGIDGEVGLTEPSALPLLASTSHGVRIVSQLWSTSRDTLNVTVAGNVGEQYELGVWNPRDIISVDGAELIPIDVDHAALRLVVRANSGSSSGDDPRLPLIIHFRGVIKSATNSSHHGMHHATHSSLEQHP